MPRGRGGPRQGTQGKSYSNRTDLQAVKPPLQVVPSQQYGQATAQMEAQRAVPIAPPPTSAIPAPGGAAPGGQPDLMGMAASFPFPQLPPLDRPSEMAGEPLTAGAPFGAGPGPEALGLPSDNIAEQLRILYRSEPNEDLREIIEELDNQAFR